MKYATIKKTDISNGPGVRVSLFVSGCRHHCKGCFNAETWDFCYGTPYTDDTRCEILDACNHDYISGLSVLGGEPFEPANQTVLVNLIERIRRELPERTIWMYTGFRYDSDLVPGGKRYTEVTDRILDQIDVLVDGPFILSRKNIRLNFRGSENQRIIDMKKTRAAGRVVLSPLNN